MTEGLGQLAFRKDGSALAYRKGGNALVFKGSPRLIDVIVNWDPHSYICTTYNMEHPVYGNITWSGEGVTLVSSEINSIGANRLSFKASGACRITLSLEISVDCSAGEYADVTVWIAASQRNSQPRHISVTPPGASTTTATATLTIDENGNLTGIE